METESQGGEGDLPKVTMGMRRGTEIEIAKPAPCLELEELLELLPLDAGGASSTEKCEQGASCLGPDASAELKEFQSTKHSLSDRERLPKLSIFICRMQAGCDWVEHG